MPWGGFVPSAPAPQTGGDDADAAALLRAKIAALSKYISPGMMPSANQPFLGMLNQGDMPMSAGDPKTGNLGPDENERRYGAMLPWLREDLSRPPENMLTAAHGKQFMAGVPEGLAGFSDLVALGMPNLAARNVDTGQISDAPPSFGSATRGLMTATGLDPGEPQTPGETMARFGGQVAGNPLTWVQPESLGLGEILSSAAARVAKPIVENPGKSALALGLAATPFAANAADTPTGRPVLDQDQVKYFQGQIKDLTTQQQKVDNDRTMTRSAREKAHTTLQGQIDNNQAQLNKLFEDTRAGQTKYDQAGMPLAQRDKDLADNIREIGLGGSTLTALVRGLFGGKLMPSIGLGAASGAVEAGLPTGLDYAMAPDTAAHKLAEQNIFHNPDWWKGLGVEALLGGGLAFGAHEAGAAGNLGAKGTYNMLRTMTGRDPLPMTAESGGTGLLDLIRRLRGGGENAASDAAAAAPTPSVRSSIDLTPGELKHFQANSELLNHSVRSGRIEGTKYTFDAADADSLAKVVQQLKTLKPTSGRLPTSFYKDDPFAGRIGTMNDASNLGMLGGRMPQP